MYVINWYNVFMAATLLLVGFLIFAVAYSAANPVSINVTSVMNKEASLELSNSEFAVFLNSSDLEERIRFENAFAKKLKINGINAFPMSEVLPPYKKYSEKEIEETLKKRGINYIIFVDILFKKTKEKYIPPTYTFYTTENTHGYYSIFTNTYTGYTTYTTTVHTHGGYTVDIPFAGYEFVILDVNFANIYWKAQAKTKSSSAFASFSIIEEKIIEEVSAAMLKELK